MYGNSRLGTIEKEHLLLLSHVGKEMRQTLDVSVGHFGGPTALVIEHSYAKLHKLPSYLVGGLEHNINFLFSH